MGTRSISITRRRFLIGLSVTGLTVPLGVLAACAPAAAPPAPAAPTQAAAKPAAAAPTTCARGSANDGAAAAGPTAGRTTGCRQWRDPPGGTLTIAVRRMSRVSIPPRPPVSATA